MQYIGILVLLTALNIFNYLDRYLVQAAQPVISKDFNINLQDSGILISSFVIGYLIFAPIFGALGDRYSKKFLMFLGAIFWSIATILTGYATGFTSFVIARILVGVGEASFGTIGPSYLSQRIKDTAKLNMAFAVFFSAIPIGSALGYVFGGYVTAHHSWRTAFIYGGVPGVFLGFMLLFLADSKKTEKLEDAQKDKISIFSKETFKTLISNKILVLAILGYIFNNFALTGVGAFIAQYGVNIGFKLEEITTKFGVVLVLAGFIGTFGGGKISQILAKKREEKNEDPISVLLKFIAVTSVLGVPFLALAVTTKDQNLLLLYSFVAEVFVFSSVAPINTVIVRSTPLGLVSFVQGLTIAFINLFGSFLSPIVVGGVADRYGLSLGLLVCGVSLGVCGVIWWLASDANKKI